MKPATQEKYRELMLLVSQAKAMGAKVDKKKAVLLAIMLKDDQDEIKGELGTASIRSRTTTVYPKEVTERIAKIKSKAEESKQVEFKSSTSLTCTLPKKPKSSD